jgi:AmiR/NasT family two-component response regulator
MTQQEREKLAADLEQEIGDLLRAKGILMDGYMCREVEATASKLAFDAVLKRDKEARQTASI